VLLQTVKSSYCGGRKSLSGFFDNDYRVLAPFTITGKMKEFSLIIKDEFSTKEIVLDSAYYSIGRSPACDIILDFKVVSRYHCGLVLMPPDSIFEDYYYLIKDGNLMGERSANGTFINGKKINIWNLQNQDEISFSPGLEYPKLNFAIASNEEPEHPTFTSFFNDTEE
jgi:pSer/pThr/pTyr-binding forkhead associated (FHA) protein